MLGGIPPRLISWGSLACAGGGNPPSGDPRRIPWVCCSIRGSVLQGGAMDPLAPSTPGTAPPPPLRFRDPREPRLPGCLVTLGCPLAPGVSLRTDAAHPAETADCWRSLAAWPAQVWIPLSLILCFPPRGLGLTLILRRSAFPLGFGMKPYRVAPGLSLVRPRARHCLYMNFIMGLGGAMRGRLLKPWLARQPPHGALPAWAE